MFVFKYTLYTVTVFCLFVFVCFVSVTYIFVCFFGKKKTNPNNKTSVLQPSALRPLLLPTGTWAELPAGWSRDLCGFLDLVNSAEMSL